MVSLKKQTRKVIVGIVMSMMMVVAMMPGAAFAQSVVAGYDVDINEPGTLLTGEAPNITADITTPDGEVAHVDWSSSDKTVAKVSTHKGKLQALSAGTAQITATVYAGEAPAGTGDGSATGCTTEVLATDTITVTVIQSTAYGFQGIGGQTMMMVNPSDITGGELDADLGYYNMINTPMTLNGNSCDFVFTMTAGMNNFSEEGFKTNSLPHIKILDENGNEVVGSDVEVPKTGWYDSASKQITITATGLAAGKTYVLEFGAGVRGNSADKTLGVPVDFEFTAK